MSNERNNAYLFVVTQFEREPDLAAAPLVVGNNALSSGADVLIWLTNDGVELAKQGEARRVQPPSFSNLGELLDKYVSAGGKIGVCPPCAKTHGITDANMVPGATMMGAPVLLNELQNRQTLSF